jgi:hypothetical protein
MILTEAISTQILSKEYGSFTHGLFTKILVKLSLFHKYGIQDYNYIGTSNCKYRVRKEICNEI